MVIAAPSHPSRLFEPAQQHAVDPIDLFRRWLADAALTEPNDPNAMALATATLDGRPSVRMVLLKALDERGFAFYTNGHSQKGDEIAANPNASACFHWKTQRRQVRIEGPVHMLPQDEADDYFHSRSRGSQVVAAASQQSRPLPTRELLETAARKIDERFPDVVPRPPEWMGYAIQPRMIEFWQDGADRLHDRMLFTRTLDGWTRTRLYP